MAVLTRQGPCAAQQQHERHCQGCILRIFIFFPHFSLCCPLRATCAASWPIAGAGACRREAEAAWTPAAAGIGAGAGVEPLECCSCGKSSVLVPCGRAGAEPSQLSKLGEKAPMPAPSGW